MYISGKEIHNGNFEEVKKQLVFMQVVTGKKQWVIYYLTI